MSPVALKGHLVCANSDEAAVVLHHLHRHIELTNAEAGCLRFDVVPTNDPFVWEVSERFVDQEAFDAHQARVRASEWGRATSHITRDYVMEAVTDDS
ncbi:MAG: putative quinol monooxygenase [Brachybacterium sp.]